MRHLGNTVRGGGNLSPQCKSDCSQASWLLRTSLSAISPGASCLAEGALRDQSSLKSKIRVINSTGLSLDRAQVSGNFPGQRFPEEAEPGPSAGDPMGRGMWRAQQPFWTGREDAVLPGRLTEPRNREELEGQGVSWGNKVREVCPSHPAPQCPAHTGCPFHNSQDSSKLSRFGFP